MSEDLPPIARRGICLSTLRLTKGDASYSSRAVRELWNGHRVRPVLGFKKEDFITIQRETADRISISGVQDKISLRLDRSRLVPTEERGDYILKPVPHTSFPKLTSDIPANEHVTMQIASQVFRIPVAANGIVFFSDGEPAYITRRFDRNTDGVPLAQEDFCQLSNRSPSISGRNYKYDASYQETGEILRRFCPSYQIEIEKLFRLIVFNYVIANGDAHMKNFSVLETALRDFALAPAYDLLCTSVHLPDESRTALELFDGEYETESFSRNGFYKRPDFVELARRFGIDEKRAANALDDFVANKADVVSLIDRSLLSPQAKVVYGELHRDRIVALSS